MPQRLAFSNGTQRPDESSTYFEERLQSTTKKSKYPLSLHWRPQNKDLKELVFEHYKDEGKHHSHLRKNPSEQIKCWQASRKTNIVIVDSANQNVEGQVNQVTHKSPNPLEHNAYGVEAKTRPQDRQATRPCNYCANCYSETTLRKYADPQRQL